MRGVPLLEHHLSFQSHDKSSVPSFAPSLQPHLLLYTKQASPCTAHSRQSLTTPCQARERAASLQVQVFCGILNYLCHPLQTCAPSDSDNAVSPHISCRGERGCPWCFVPDTHCFLEGIYLQLLGTKEKKTF